MAGARASTGGKTTTAGLGTVAWAVIGAVIIATATVAVAAYSDHVWTIPTQTGRYTPGGNTTLYENETSTLLNTWDWVAWGIGFATHSFWLNTTGTTTVSGYDAGLYGVMNTTSFNSFRYNGNFTWLDDVNLSEGPTTPFYLNYTGSTGPGNFYCVFISQLASIGTTVSVEIHATALL